MPTPIPSRLHPSPASNYLWINQIEGGEHGLLPKPSLSSNSFPTYDDFGTKLERDYTSGEQPPKIGQDSTQLLKSLETRAIRSRPSNWKRTSSQVSPIFSPLKQSFELPPPASPPRRRRTLRRNWYHALYATANYSNLRSRPSIFLALYFALNLGLTLSNKSLLIKFPFPYTISALHALSSSIGCFVLVASGSSPMPHLNGRESLLLFGFSILYTVNIIISNVSLRLVTIPFHQIVRASTPLFIILLSAFIHGSRSSRAKLIALVPVIAGVGFATYGDYYFTPWGFFLTLLGTILAALKTIYTNVLQKPSVPSSTSNTHTPKSPRARSLLLDRDTPSPHKTKLPSLTPLHLVCLLSPLAFIQSISIAYVSGELDLIHLSPTISFAHAHPPAPLGFFNSRLALLVMNGAMAFALNVVSFSANKKVGALSMTVVANVKQALTILCAVILFDLNITPMNGFGIALTLFGGAVYARVELQERQERIV